MNEKTVEAYTELANIAWSLASRLPKSHSGYSAGFPHDANLKTIKRVNELLDIIEWERP